MTPNRNRRAVVRVACGINVVVEYDRGAQVPCRTIDLSMSGAQIRFPGSPRMRDQAMDRLIIPGAGFFAIAPRWIDGARAGVRFTGPPRETDVVKQLLDHLESMRQAHQAKEIHPTQAIPFSPRDRPRA